jgi:undecaprenyl-diphosphatase
MDVENASSYLKAKRLFARHGGLALVIGRFLGPVAGLVSFAAALSGMGRKRFTLWNLFGAFPYALAHVSLGYFLGDAFFKLGPFVGRMVLFGFAFLMVIMLVWYLVVRIKRKLPFVISVVRSMFIAARENPEMLSWASRHPRISQFLANRVDTRHFFGLTATFLSVVFLYILFIWLGTVFEFLMADPIQKIDTRLANLIYAFWDPTLLRIFAHVTAIGDWRIISILFIGALVALGFQKRFDLMLGLSLTLIGNVALVAILKAIFHRPRPPLAYFVETSGSFPSGHAAISIAFYGMLFYTIWRLRLLGPVMAMMLAATIAFMIGLSRIYLIEHYLSDVLNGYLVGALWLVIGIALSEWWRETHPAPQDGSDRMLVPAFALLVAIGGAGWVNYNYDNPHNTAQLGQSAETITSIPALFTTGKAQPTSESITGTPLEPISLIIVAKDAAAFEVAMKQAGWIEADKPSISTLSRAAFAAWSNQQDATAPVTPYFWNRQPNDYGFQKPTLDKTLRKRHHARFWNTSFITQGGAHIFVGTASFDDGLSWGVLHHIDPNIDNERDTLVMNLKSANQIVRSTEFQLSTPHLGTDVAGDPWFTDGKAIAIWTTP